MTRIGFIGVGTMGLPMAKNLVNKGFAVTAYDTNAEAARAAASAGMTAAASAAEAVATADLVITMLPSSPHAESVYTGDGGVLAAARKGTLCVDMSTIDPSVSRRIAAAATERGVRFMDAPVSGGVPRAAEGTLAIMVGGAQDDFDEALPALSAMGANVIRVGPVGSGEVVKLCNNLIAGVAAVAISEAFRIADGFGVDPKVVTQVISKSSGHTWVMEHMHPVPGLSPNAFPCSSPRRRSSSTAWRPLRGWAGRTSPACTLCSSLPRIPRPSRPGHSWGTAANRPVDTGVTDWTSC